MNNIDLIIKHLTNELDALKQELDKCVNGNDPDYEGAQVFQKAIQSKSAEIRVLVKRRDANTEEINQFRMRAKQKNATIKKQEERFFNFSGDPSRLPNIEKTIKFYKQELNEINNKITELNLTNRSKHIDEDILLTQIENLFKTNDHFLCLEISEQYQNFEPIFKYLSVLSYKKDIQIEYVINSMIQSDREIRNRFLLAKLTQLGFQLNTHQNWILSLKKDQTNPVQIHQILSILCFEIITLSGKNTCRLMIS